MTKAFRGIRLLLPAAFIFGLVSCAAMEGQESGGQYVDDASISTRIRAEFVKDPVVQAMQVHVETMQGVVELSGFVSNKNAEYRAVDIARNTKGVKDVHDDIIVR